MHARPHLSRQHNSTHSSPPAAVTHRQPRCVSAAAHRRARRARSAYELTTVGPSTVRQQISWSPCHFSACSRMRVTVSAYGCMLPGIAPAARTLPPPLMLLRHAAAAAGQYGCALRSLMGSQHGAWRIVSGCEGLCKGQVAMFHERTATSCAMAPTVWGLGSRLLNNAPCLQHSHPLGCLHDLSKKGATWVSEECVKCGGAGLDLQLSAGSSTLWFSACLDV